MRKPEIFSDFVNGVLFHGVQRVLPDKLTLLERETTLKIAAGSKKENRLQGIRDVVYEADMEDSRKVIFQVILGLENQSFVDYGMVIRNLVYDASVYGRQLKRMQRKNRGEKNLKSGNEFLSGIHPGDMFVPVITLTFYYGEDAWDGKQSLYEILDIPKEEKWLYNYINNYRIHLVHAENVQSQDFKTGLRNVFELLRVADNAKSMETYLSEHEEEYRNVPEETWELLMAFFSEGDMKLMQEKEHYENQEGGYNMCTAFRQMREMGEERGIQIGEERGEYGRLIRQIRRKLDKGQSPQQMAEALEEDVNTICKIVELLREAEGTGEDNEYIIRQLCH